MILLALSDIHGNIDSVRQLRAHEENIFDAVILAGDIGHSVAEQIFEIIASFNCPIFYIYGNHDYALRYDQNFGENCYHLHMKAISHGSAKMCGFSGCPDSWGENPIAVRIKAEVRQSYHDILAAHGEASQALEAAYKIHEAETDDCDKFISQSLSALAAKAKAKSIDRRRADYRKREENYRRRTYRAYCHNNKAFRVNEKAYWERHKALLSLENSREYKNYLATFAARYEEILTCNRDMLSETISVFGNSKEKLIVVTHARLARTSTDFPVGTLFLFGHRHGFADTVYHGCRYVNVSALDNCIAFRPRHLDEFEWEDCKVVNAGTYAVIKLRSSGEIEVTRMSFDLPDKDWIAVRDRSYVYRDGQIVRFASE
jgi:predicted phosphodiesterase